MLGYLGYVKRYVPSIVIKIRRTVPQADIWRSSSLLYKGVIESNFATGDLIPHALGGECGPQG